MSAQSTELKPFETSQPRQEKTPEKAIVDRSPPAKERLIPTPKKNQAQNVRQQLAPTNSQTIKTLVPETDEALKTDSPPPPTGVDKQAKIGRQGKQQLAPTHKEAGKSDVPLTESPKTTEVPKTVSPKTDSKSTETVK